MVLGVAEGPQEANYGVWDQGEGSIAWYGHWGLGTQQMWNETAWHCTGRRVNRTTTTNNRMVTFTH